MASLRDQLVAAQLMQRQRQSELADAQQRLVAATPRPVLSPSPAPPPRAPTTPVPSSPITLPPVSAPTALRDTRSIFSRLQGMYPGSAERPQTVTTGVKG